MSFNFEQKYSEYLEEFNVYLDSVLSSLDKNAPSLIVDAMRYAVEGGGKRVRPILCIATADVLGLSFDDVKEFALAIELIHSYSLVHDDLPAMDNDDYRRGKLSTHKKFGEAYGILAGDALLNFAFELCLSKQNMTQNHIDACRVIAEYAGYKGMIAGQVLDLLNEKNPNANEDVLYSIFENKTSKLLTAPLLAASLTANGKYYDTLKEFGLNLGVLFQITDDIMDEEGTLASIGKTPHKDKEVDKLTSVKLFGLDGAKKLAKERYTKCIELLSKVSGSDFLLAFTDKMFTRKS